MFFLRTLVLFSSLHFSFQYKSEKSYFKTKLIRVMVSESIFKCCYSYQKEMYLACNNSLNRNQILNKK